MALDPSLIMPGNNVYAHHMDANDNPDVGQFVGEVVDLHEHNGVEYIHVRGGIARDNDLYVPLGAVFAVGADEVHLNLSPEDLAGTAWHQPPGG